MEVSSRQYVALAQTRYKVRAVCLPMFPFVKTASIHYGSQAAGYPGRQKRKARMSFNDLAKKEAADKKAHKKKIRIHNPQPNDPLNQSWERPIRKRVEWRD